MTHGDDNGIVLPPMVAPSHVVLLPIYRNPEDRATVMPFVDSLAEALRQKSYGNRSIGVEIDDRDIGGARGWEWIKKGIPLRVEIGPRDMANDAVFVGRRDRDQREKISIKREQFITEIPQLLDSIQSSLFERAIAFQKDHTTVIDDAESFHAYFTPSNKEKPEIHGGFALTHWCGDSDCEVALKEKLGITIRCIPLAGSIEEDGGGRCIHCGKASSQRVVFAKAY